MLYLPRYMRLGAPVQGIIGQQLPVDHVSFNQKCQVLKMDVGSKGRNDSNRLEQTCATWGINSEVLLHHCPSFRERTKKGLRFIFPSSLVQLISMEFGLVYARKT